jgi:hypothetical membrane protein
MTVASSREETVSLSQKFLDRNRAGILFIAGSLLFLLLTTAGEAIYPNFNIQNNAISDLAALGTSTTAIEEIAILALAICWIAGAYVLFRNTERKGLMVLNLLPGFGFLLAGIFPENVSTIMHSVGALLAFPFGVIVVFLSYRLIQAPVRYFTLGLGALSLVATFVTFLGSRFVGPCGTCASNLPAYNARLDELALGLGGWESMIIYPILVWLMIFGSYLVARSSGAPQ